ncbi:MAG: IclR family transcriptional regulator [Bacillota bacterium]|nr:IclR family transcriptional regulator [Bacillota bacterium]
MPVGRPGRSQPEVTRAVDRALQILLLLGAQGEMGVTEIASQLGTWKSTVHRTLATLAARGFVVKQPGTDRYFLGVKLFSLGMRWREKVGLVPIVRPVMEQLAASAGETVHLVVLDADPAAPHTVVVVDRVESDHVLGITPRVGFGSAAHCSAVGKVLLAHSPAEVVKQIIRTRGLPRLTPYTITTEEALRAELAAVRDRGYAVDNEEMEIGLYCVAAPIRDVSGSVVAAMSVSGPVGRLAPRQEESARAVVAAARAASARLG